MHDSEHVGRDVRARDTFALGRIERFDDEALDIANVLRRGLAEHNRSAPRSGVIVCSGRLLLLPACSSSSASAEAFSGLEA